MAIQFNALYGQNIGGYGAFWKRSLTTVRLAAWPIVDRRVHALLPLDQMATMLALDGAASSNAQAQLRAGTCVYQAIHSANAKTITPAQYQPRIDSSVIGSSSLSREGIIHPF